MKFEITAKEIAKSAEVLKMFGVPDVDIATINEAFEARYENWSTWEFSWGRTTINPLAMSVEIYEDSVCKILDSYEDLAPTVNKIIGVFSALKPLFNELSDVAGKVADKIGNVFKTNTKVELYGDADTIIIACRYDNGSFTVPSFSGPDGFTDVDAEKYVREHRPVSEETSFVKRNDFRIGVYRALMERALRHRAEFGSITDFNVELELGTLEERFFNEKRERNN